LLKTVILEQGIAIEYADELGGALGTSSGGCIRLLNGLSPAMEFTTLVTSTLTHVREAVMCHWIESRQWTGHCFVVSDDIIGVRHESPTMRWRSITVPNLAARHQVLYRRHISEADARVDQGAINARDGARPTGIARN
jgi:hypothetical protein